MAGPLLTRRQLNRATLTRQLLTARADLDVVAAVRALGGLQAQEARPPFVGLWSRLAGFERETLRTALHARTVVRATGVRATLHLVTAADYVDSRVHLEEMFSDGLRVLGARLAGLDRDRTIAAARRHLADGPLTFNELRPRLAEEFPDANDRALGYVTRLLLPLVMVPTDDVWGFPSTAAFTPAESWLGRPVASRATVGDLVLRYLAAFGPATVTDFQNWSGLARMRGAFDELRARLVTFTDERKRELFDLPDAPRPDPDTPVPPRLLPEFDSLLLAHDDRSRVIAEAHRAQVVTKNLRVNAVFLVDGEVAGLWSAERKRATATLVLRPFARLPSAVRAEVIAEAEAALPFVQPEASTFHVTVVG